MPYYSPEKLAKVRDLDLLTYLKNYDPDELVPYCKDTYVTREHDSLKISNGKWYWFSHNIGGKSALDYLVVVKDYSFMDAVEKILGNTNNAPPINYNFSSKEQTKIFNLPKRNSNNDKIISYLTGRGIDKDIILECIDNELIYEQDSNHNVVFVGYDSQKTPRYAMCRGTNSSRYMKEEYGSHKAFSFKLDSLNDSNTVHLFESAIDLLSYATLLKLDNKEWYNENLLSLAGVYQPAKNIEESKLPLALNYYLNQHPNIEKIVLHFDNDAVGRNASKALQMIIPNRYEIIDDPPCIGKDVNDFLCNKLGITITKNKIKER